MKKTWLKEFENPGCAYRGAPFWAWNGTLQPEELRRQVRLMRRMGLGGFFMHSRVGLDTPYLSEEWFECVRACIDEAQKQDMKAWLYDEDRWPSGAAGGLVTKNPAYRQRRLQVTELRAHCGPAWAENSVASFTARIAGSAAREVRPVARGAEVRLGADESLLRFDVQVAECSDWYNGQTYLDTLNREAVAEFIRVTHERYREACGESFGRSVPGIFTDEPNRGLSLAYTGSRQTHPFVSWTDTLPQVFRERYGYDLLPRLVEVFFDVDGHEISQARWHFHDCLTFMFVDAFARQIGEWCEKNGLMHTGHVLTEETLASQTCYVGAAMRFYEYMQAPGMDLLRECNREYDTAKCVSSVARQFGRQWRLTETYGCTGWDFPFAGHKALGDWQAALGINLRCQHLAWYTMEGEAKRDYPAGIFYQSPWWESYAKVEDYFARLHVAMTRGKEVRDLLVIHPIESMWVTFKLNPEYDTEMDVMDRRLMDLRDTLLSAGVDFDYGDEDLLARHGRAGRDRQGRVRLRLGRAEYRAVTVPHLKTIRSTTLALLRKFKAAGGTVVFAGPAPGYVDAQPSEAAREFAQTCATTSEAGPDLVAAVEAAARRIAVTDGAGRPLGATLHLLREDADAFYLFVCNTGLPTDAESGRLLEGGLKCRERALERQARFPDARIRGFASCAGQPLELDLETGEVFAAEAAREKDAWTIRTDFAALQSRLFVMPKRADGPAWPRRAQWQTVRRTPLRDADWNVRLSDRNGLVLDRPAYRIGGRPWQGAEEILRVDGRVREALGVKRRGGQMVQPWAREKPVRPRREKVALRYEFDIETLPDGPVSLGLERPDLFAVTLNGVEVSMDAENGWWCDRSLRTVPLPVQALRTGVNELTLTCDYEESHPGLEIVYLLGDFGVRVRGTRVALRPRPQQLKIGDWTGQGLPFYSGSVAYERAIRPVLKEGERLWVALPEFRGVAARVWVNGALAGVVAWEPQEVEITGLLRAGANALSIEVVAHRRNSHGPLHHAERWHDWTGPGQFVTRNSQWQDGYSLVPCGLTRAPELLVRRARSMPKN
jgi:hypothetical protein